MKNTALITAILVLLAACTAQPPTTPVSGNPTPPAENPYLPQPGDEALLRGNVYLDSVDLLILESFPVQIMLVLRGNVPDPCHQLRLVVGQPDEQNRIEVEAYSLGDPTKICIQVLAPFEVNLNLGSFPAGTYTVWVNGEQVGEFDA